MIYCKSIFEKYVNLDIYSYIYVEQVILNNLLYESLITSINYLQKSKYGKGNKRKLSYVLGALHQAKSIFPAETSIKQISFRNIPLDDQIPTILEHFIDSFIEQCLKKGKNTAKNYSLFSIVSLKIVKTMDDGQKKRSCSSTYIKQTK